MGMGMGMKMTTAALCVAAATAYAQNAQKPIVMVMPEKAWCVQQGYSPDGKSVDYAKAMTNPDVLNVIAEMNGIMADYGYPMKDLSAALGDIGTEDAMDMALQSKGDGEIVEDDLDKLVRVAQADILVNIAFDRASNGPRPQIRFRVSSIDAATSKAIDGQTGVSSASAQPVNILLKEAVLGFMDNFCGKIQRHFDDVAANGREGTVIFKIASDCPLNMESEVSLNGDTGELSELLEYWLGENSIDGAFTTAGKSRARAAYEQVRFPLFGKGVFGGRPKAQNAEGFIKPIGKLLGQFGISVSTTPSGIGKVYVVLGGK